MASHDGDEKTGIILYAMVSRDGKVLSEYAATSGNFPTIARVLVSKLNKESSSSRKRNSYQYDSYLFHYIIRESNDDDKSSNTTLYLCMTTNNNTNNNTILPFQYLESLAAYQKAPDGITPTILAKEIANTESGKIKKVQSSLDSVKSVMIENIDRVLERAEKIELLVDRTTTLNATAFRFEKKSRELRSRIVWNARKKKLLAGTLCILVLYLMVAGMCSWDFSSCLPKHHHDPSEEALVYNFNNQSLADII